MSYSYEPSSPVFDFNNSPINYDPNSPVFDPTSPAVSASYDSPQDYYQYQSEPLVRYASSGGSSYSSSSIPNSPLDNGFYSLYNSPTSAGTEAVSEHPYSPTSAPSSSTTMTPRSEAISNNRDWPVSCLAPGCNARPFKRCADLQRHYKNTHAPEAAKDRYLCDYQKCPRYREPFHRRDHFRDHLREYHREDIMKRGDTVSEDWLDSRYAPQTWWRCPRCLVRVYINRHNFECPGCKTSCEPKRKERRRRHS